MVSTTLTDASAWRNSTLIKDNVVEQVRALKAQPGKNILIDGSSVLVHTLAQHDLIDEYSLLVYPVVWAAARRSFPDGLRTNLRLVETRSFPTGVCYALRRRAAHAAGAERTDSCTGTALMHWRDRQGS